MAGRTAGWDGMRFAKPAGGARKVGCTKTPEWAWRAGTGGAALMGAIRLVS